jgi:hypothetical protein
LPASLIQKNNVTSTHVTKVSNWFFLQIHYPSNQWYLSCNVAIVIISCQILANYIIVLLLVLFISHSLLTSDLSFLSRLIYILDSKRFCLHAWVFYLEEVLWSFEFFDVVELMIIIHYIIWFSSRSNYTCRKYNPQWLHLNMVWLSLSKIKELYPIAFHSQKIATLIEWHAIH